jgi:hypothetical protein
MDSLDYNDVPFFFQIFKSDLLMNLLHVSGSKSDMLMDNNGYEQPQIADSDSLNLLQIKIREAAANRYDWMVLLIIVIRLL